jgi:polysaccharide pyruvyl transferase WcaK-like protein
MKILIVGERYSTNLGDPIICESVEYLIKEANQNAEVSFLDLSGKKEFGDWSGSRKLIYTGRISTFKKKSSICFTNLGIDTEYLKFKKSHKRKIGYFHDYLDDADFDIAIFAGGQMFKDTFIFPISTVVKYLDNRDIPVIFNACGYGEIASKKMRSILEKSLNSNNVKMISSRDDIKSINILLDNEKKEVIRTYDPALWTKEVYNVSRIKSDIVGLGVMYAHNMKYKEMLNFWKRIINELNEKNIKWKMFCNGPAKDYEFAKHILKSMNYEEENLNRFIIEAPKRPKDLVETISSFKGIISFRLHSHIVACSLGVPGVSIMWDKKVKYFYENIQEKERVFELHSDSTEVVGKLLESINNNYDEAIIREQKVFLKNLLVENSVKNWRKV